MKLLVRASLFHTGWFLWFYACAEHVSNSIGLLPVWYWFQPLWCDRTWQGCWVTETWIRWDSWWWGVDRSKVCICDHGKAPLFRGNVFQFVPPVVREPSQHGILHSHILAAGRTSVPQLQHSSLSLPSGILTVTLSVTASCFCSWVLYPLLSEAKVWPLTSACHVESEWRQSDMFLCFFLLINTHWKNWTVIKCSTSTDFT